jgi:drug/metabolite transporter (DMT)-like permease
MTWFLLAILTAIAESFKDVTSKRILKEVDEYIVVWSLFVFTLPILLPLLFFIKIPTLGNQFWSALWVDGSLNVVAMILYIKAINRADLSLTVPLVAFTPLFLLITSPIIVQEYPTAQDIVGILTIVTGSYILNLREKNKGYLAPLQALWNHTSSRLMLAVALIWSVSAAIDKVGVQNSSPIIWSISIYSFIALGISPIMLYKSKHNLKQIKSNLPMLMTASFFMGIGILLQMQAIKIALVAQVISIKRISTLITVFLGHFLFHEPGLKERAAGAAIMILGVVLIAI